MKVVNIHVIDTDSLIKLKMMNPMDIYVTPWENMKKLIDTDQLISPKEVLHEIARGDDELKNWAGKQQKLFKELDPFQINKVREIQSEFPSWIDPNKETAIADPFVIALALEQESQQTLVPTIKKKTLVSEEKLDGNKIKIPFVCQKYDIECINIFELFRKLGWKF